MFASIPYPVRQAPYPCRDGVGASSSSADRHERPAHARRAGAYAIRNRHCLIPGTRLLGRPPLCNFQRGANFMTVVLSAPWYEKFGFLCGFVIFLV